MISTSSRLSNGLSYIWHMKRLREKVLSRLDTGSLRNLRLTASVFLEETTPLLFKKARIVFTARSLTQSIRLEALSCVGDLIEHLTFTIPHSNKNHLPPLINPKTGREINFIYTPYFNKTYKLRQLKYGSKEVEDILIHQYPPIFHAATNVPAFINLISMMSNLRSINISCQNKYVNPEYKRSVVDYVLISLRIALERVPLIHLKKLSLFHIHPAGFCNLRHTLGYGCTPSASRRWKQIKELHITTNFWDFHGNKSSRNHIRILDDFIRSFAPNLEKMRFIWNGEKGPYPFSGFKSQDFDYFEIEPKLFGETTSSMSPLPARPSRPSVVFPLLRYLQLSNMRMTNIQVADLILRHHTTVRKFQFDEICLVDGSSWEEALIPLNLVDNRDEWLLCQSSCKSNRSTTFNSYLQWPLSEPVVDEVVETINPISDRRFPINMSGITTNSIELWKGEPKNCRVRRRSHKEGINRQFEFNKTKNFVSSHYNSHQKSPNPNIQGVQRNLQTETAQLELLFDSEKRISALKKAKQAVLKQLRREFLRESKNIESHQENLNNRTLASISKMMYSDQDDFSALVPLILSR